MGNQQRNTHCYTFFAIFFGVDLIFTISTCAIPRSPLPHPLIPFPPNPTSGWEDGSGNPERNTHWCAFFCHFFSGSIRVFKFRPVAVPRSPYPISSSTHFYLTPTPLHIWSRNTGPSIGPSSPIPRAIISTPALGALGRQQSPRRCRSVRVLLIWVTSNTKVMPRRDIHVRCLIKEVDHSRSFVLGYL